MYGKLLSRLGELVIAGLLLLIPTSTSFLSYVQTHSTYNI